MQRLAPVRAGLDQLAQRHVNLYQKPKRPLMICRWYLGTVKSYDGRTRRHTIAYKDGDAKDINLKHEAVVLVDDSGQRPGGGGGAERSPVDSKASGSTPGSSKRKQAAPGSGKGGAAARKAAAEEKAVAATPRPSRQRAEAPSDAGKDGGARATVTRADTRNSGGGSRRRPSSRSRRLPKRDQRELRGSPPGVHGGAARKVTGGDSGGRQRRRGDSAAAAAGGRSNPSAPRKGDSGTGGDSASGGKRGRAATGADDTAGSPPKVARLFEEPAQPPGTPPCARRETFRINSTSHLDRGSWDRGTACMAVRDQQLALLRGVWQLAQPAESDPASCAGAAATALANSKGWQGGAAAAPAAGVSRDGVTAQNGMDSAKAAAASHPPAALQRPAQPLAPDRVKGDAKAAACAPSAGRSGAVPPLQRMRSVADIPAVPSPAVVAAATAAPPPASQVQPPPATAASAPLNGVNSAAAKPAGALNSGTLLQSLQRQQQQQQKAGLAGQFANGQLANGHATAPQAAAGQSAAGSSPLPPQRRLGVMSAPASTMGLGFSPQATTLQVRRIEAAFQTSWMLLVTHCVVKPPRQPRGCCLPRIVLCH